jgi:hypothetical protein
MKQMDAAVKFERVKASNIMCGKGSVVMDFFGVSVTE